MKAKSKATVAESVKERASRRKAHRRKERARPQPVEEKSGEREMRFGVTLLRHIAAE